MAPWVSQSVLGAGNPLKKVPNLNQRWGWPRVMPAGPCEPRKPWAKLYWRCFPLHRMEPTIMHIHTAVVALQLSRLCLPGNHTAWQDRPLGLYQRPPCAPAWFLMASASYAPPTCMGSACAATRVLTAALSKIRTVCSLGIRRVMQLILASGGGM